jgi:exopolysaccharide biosynthesis polyprenyl glycosylphosphotransferase
MIPRRFFWSFDIVTLAVAFLATYWVLPLMRPGILLLERIRPQLSDAFAIQSNWPGEIPRPTEWLWEMLVISMATLLVNEMWNGYGALHHTSRLRIIARSAIAPLIGLSAVTLIQFASKSPGVSRLLLFLSVLVAGLGLASYRLLLWTYFRHRVKDGYYAKNTVLIGLRPAVGWVTRYFAKEVSLNDYALSGYLRVLPDQAESEAGFELPCLGNVEELGAMLIHRPIHEVIVVQPAAGGEWLAKVVDDCDYFRIPLSIIPETLLQRKLQDLRFGLQEPLLQLPALVLRPHEIHSESLFLKRLLDVVVSATLLVLLSPLFALIALAIKITDRRLPVFYPWRVVGLKGREFTGYKFTTMCADADQRKAQLMGQNQMSGPVFKIKDDPRITPLGRILRKFSLNELPQLWSVLKGDMSLVGPRPAFPHELARYQWWHKRKLSVQPGITCLWQIRGRNKISNFDDWVKMDLEYIHSWSLWLDLQILFRTAWIVVLGTGS